MNRMRKVYGCPVELSLDLLGGKWKSVILARLKDQPLAYGELRHLIPELSDKVLTQRLKGLEEHGLVARERGPGQPSRSRYFLTDRGQSMRPLLQALYDWGEGAAPEFEVRFR
jgi:DNA-binding HxlR family transcriptional regulator